VTYSFRPYHVLEVDSAPSENEYQEHLLRVSVAGAWGWQPHHLHVPNVMEIWEPKPLGTFYATPGLLREYCTFFSCQSLLIFKRLFAKFVKRVYPPACNNRTPTGRVLLKSDIWIFFERHVRL